jgi:hypothetical protein
VPSLPPPDDPWVDVVGAGAACALPLEDHPDDVVTAAWGWC